MLWPPQLEDVRRELKRTTDDVADDLLLQELLDAAVAYVERERFGDFDFDGSSASVLLPDPSPDLVKGTVRLAVRWHVRASSPAGLVDLGELGSARVPTVDADIDRMLGVGRFRRPMV